MLRGKKVILVLLALIIAGVTFGASQNQISNMDSSNLSLSPIGGDAEDAVLLYETESFVFSFKDARDVLSIFDKRNGYTWKSGVDIADSRKVKEGLRQGEAIGFEPIEERLNATYTSIANALITIEYYDKSLGIKRLSSASDTASSTLYSVKDSDGHFVLDVTFGEIDLSMRVHIHLSDEGYALRIPQDEMTGEGRSILGAILLNPFLGASGGMHALYDESTNSHGEPVNKEPIAGYVFVPDGPGALIPFQDYGVSLMGYSSKVYGRNHSKGTYNQIGKEEPFVPLKTPLMPLYGIAHTNHQAAFLGYATKGDTAMEVVVTPKGNTTLYTWAYPNFVYNTPYYQVFNKRGDGYFTLFDEPFQFDIEFNYVFIAEEKNKDITADYIGMAKLYRMHLEREGILGTKLLPQHAPIRLDFIMSDQKKSVIGLENVVVTKAEDVRSIFDKLKALGVDEISSGLYGWQDGGITAGKPWRANWSNAIGSKNDFKSLVEAAKEKGIDLSFAQDYLNINSEQTKVQRSRIKHANNWYLTARLNDSYPISEFYYAKPELSVEWLGRQLSELEALPVESHTVEGISSTLLTHHDRDLTHGHESFTIGIYEEALKAIHQNLALNLRTPNKYLWAYTDRFLEAPVNATGYLIQSETVPFLSFLLNGSMEVFAPYGNFSFQSKSDLLKLVDYNLSPAFAVTQEAAYFLSDTNSMNFYSTEYSEYEALIVSAYTYVNDALSAVRNAKWTGRVMLDQGVYLNTYDNGERIVINYTNKPFEYLSHTVDPVSYRSLSKEGQ
ncbi:MAG TPA: hypothetical protein DCS67_05505 [Clostridiales bacterium UBA8960]|nr:hypothetical protein [Clostridiales bacterium UBA8960]